MPILADYLVVAKPNFRLEPHGADRPASMSLTFRLPPGVRLDQYGGEPLLHYRLTHVYAPAQGAMELVIELNGTEIRKQSFHSGARNLLVEDILFDIAVDPPPYMKDPPPLWRAPVPFDLAGDNSLTFRAVSPDPEAVLVFSSVVLWFKRDTEAA